MNKVYISGPNRAVGVITNNAVVEFLNPRHDLRNHSPDGFEWGYEGSGPAQLALAICADLLGDNDRALRVYQEFKRKVVATLPQDKFWALRGDDVSHIISEIERIHSLN